MITELCIDSDKQAKKDGKRLKDINLTKDEWNAISVKLSNSNINEVDAVDFTEPSTAFDDDDEYEDSEDGDIANNQSKQHKNIPRLWINCSIIRSSLQILILYLSRTLQ
ncbi:hypothetical protein RclHR1_02530016 [Rhizophagus clarus]|uniref:Uncharacterized protein n=1 Tax=Rhizophagus clarus TaxID=94130 RepID=A0A2Z6RER9_9GLOM|nr:hypothetical protein RclHR1_16030003 [Rhizophagus clarus]GBB95421.1 hypothetical protein RclHR1_02530016 [Rhizophagus clarus]